MKGLLKFCEVLNSVIYYRIGQVQIELTTDYRICERLLKFGEVLNSVIYYRIGQVQIELTTDYRIRVRIVEIL